MKITHNQLRRIIKEEYERATPVQPGQIMSEARAMYLAEQVMNEGILGDLWAGFAGAGKKAGEKAGEAITTAGKKAGEIAGDVRARAKQAVEKVAAPLKKAGETAVKAIEDIADAGLKAAAKNSAKDIEASLFPIIKSEVAKMIAKLVKSGETEQAAQAAALGMVSQALSVAIGRMVQAGFIEVE